MSTPTGATPAHSGGRRALVLAVKILVSVGLLALLLSRIESARFWAYARTASIRWLVAALLLYFVMIAMSAWRWGLLLNAQQVRVPASRPRDKRIREPTRREPLRPVPG